MRIIGLTGNIGSGKSTVAKMFEELGAKIIDADKIAREVVEPGKPAWKELISEFGNGILNKDKELNRKLVADIVFNDDNKREILNSIIHPRILEEINNRIDKNRSENTEITIIEAALLIEKGGLINFIDKLIVVSIDKDSQLKRIKARDNLSREEVLSRIESQMGNDEKTKHADFIIDNTGSIKNTEQQVKEIWESLNLS
ncbi:MAG: dephospho-CoA kinase [Thermodesulfobacteriota bacterium]